MAHAVTIRFNAPLDLQTEGQVRDWIAETIPLSGDLDADVEIDVFDVEETD